jgi:hypothetical protein
MTIVFAPTATPNEIRSLTQESRPPVNHTAYNSTPPIFGQLPNTSQSLWPAPALSAPLPSSNPTSTLKLEARPSQLLNRLGSELAISGYPRTLSPIPQATNSGNTSIKHCTNRNPIDVSREKGLTLVIVLHRCHWPRPVATAVIQPTTIGLPSSSLTLGIILLPFIHHL